MRKTLSTCFLVLILSLNVSAKDNSTHELDMKERFAFQKAIESVFSKHRSQSKSDLSDEIILKKVEETLRKSNALQIYWQRDITAAELQSEIDRIVNHTKDPKTLSEIFNALNNHPFIIAECLARPILADRIIRELYAYDTRFHGALKKAIELSLLRNPNPDQLQNLGGKYQLRSVNKTIQSRDKSNLLSKTNELQQTMNELRNVFHTSQLRKGDVSALQEDQDRFWIIGIVDIDDARLITATVEWPKQTFETWWESVKNRLEVKLSIPAFRFEMPKISPLGGGDFWTPTSIVNAPIGRAGHTAVWTGMEMIVWGGFGALNSGGRYTPALDSWTPVSMTNAPGGRYGHTAVWTGTYMIIWGGFDNITWLNSGGAYDVSADSWSDVAALNAPSPRAGHRSVWTGSEMIVWGGYDGVVTTNTGGRYDPVQDIWTSTNTVGAPLERSVHAAEWTGTEMIVWGGNSTSQDFLDTGGRYNPTTDSWIPTSLIGVPAGRQIPSSVWTATEMIIWGGSNDDPDFYLNSGARYNPNTDSWLATNIIDAPLKRHQHTAVWTGNEMIIWGGSALGGITDTGSRYDPATDSWTVTTMTNAPSARFEHSAVWTNNEMVVWGGFDGVSNLQTGASYTILIVDCFFCDDFEDGILDPGWTYLKPSWNETGGSLVGVPVKRKAITIATPIFAGCTTCTIQTQIQTAGGIGNKVWLLGWYLSKKDTVEIMMKEESDKWVLKQRVGGRVIAKQKGLKTIDPNVFYVVQVTFDGANFQVFIDDLLNPLITMPAGAPPSGTVGFQVKNTTGSFGEISVN